MAASAPPATPPPRYTEEPWAFQHDEQIVTKTALMYLKRLGARREASWIDILQPLYLQQNVRAIQVRMLELLFSMEPADRPVSIERDKDNLLDLATRINDLERVRQLVEVFHANPNGDRETAGLPISRAAGKGYLGVVTYLLEEGADPNCGLDLCLGTALARASFHGKEEVVDKLIECGALVDTACPEGHTPLMCAAQGGAYHVALRLLRAGADRELRSQEGLTARDYAQRANDEKLVALLDSM